jgi:hypothetical protein
MNARPPSATLRPTGDMAIVLSRTTTVGGPPAPRLHEDRCRAGVRDLDPVRKTSCSPLLGAMRTPACNWLPIVTSSMRTDRALTTLTPWTPLTLGQPAALVGPDAVDDQVAQDDVACRVR